MRYIPESYQVYATDWQIEHPYCGTFLEMGLGKTIATLTTIDLLTNRLFEVSKTLVIAPKTVVENTWPDEIEKWDHTRHLKYSLIAGKADKRLKAIRKQADIYLVGVDNLAWLIAALGGYWPFQLVVIDESSKFKAHDSQRFRAIVKNNLMPERTRRVILLSGTPMGEGYLGLWSQMYLLDKGARLGKNISTYRNDYFIKDYSGWGYTLRDNRLKEVITGKISDICISMRQKDYLNLPERIERRVQLKMSPELKQAYKDFERDRVMELLASEKQVTAVNAGVLDNKLRQFANGAVYDDEGIAHEVHTLKIEALLDIVDTSAGHPVLVIYEFVHDRERIMKALKRYKPVHAKEKNFVKDWNEGKIKVGVGHPDNMGHGLNLQYGGNILVVFGHTWSSEKRKQVIARLERKGQMEAVILHDLVVTGTMDEKVLNRQQEKINDESAMMDAIRAVIRQYKKDFEYAETPQETFLDWF